MTSTMPGCPPGDPPAMTGNARLAFNSIALPSKETVAASEKDTALLVPRPGCHMTPSFAGRKPRVAPSATCRLDVGVHGRTVTRALAPVTEGPLASASNGSLEP
jgi:hypothetical protein